MTYFEDIFKKFDTIKEKGVTMTIFYNKSKNEWGVILFYIIFISFLGIVSFIFYFSNFFPPFNKIAIILSSLVAVIGSYINANSNKSRNSASVVKCRRRI